MAVGSPDDLARMEEKLQKSFEIKTIVVGTNEERGEVREARILNRIIRIMEDGWEYEVDQRHADLIVQETGAATMSTLTHPGGEKKTMEEE